MKKVLLILVLACSIKSISQDLIKNCSNQVTGKVVNKQSKASIPNALVQLKLNGKIVEQTHSDVNGSFAFNLECDSRYQISAVFENYSKSIKLVFTAREDTSHEVLLEMIPLSEFKIVGDKRVIVMENIEFEPDDFTVGKEIGNQLDIVVELMNKYTQIQIEIGFHSNNMGDLNFLKSLTQKRADACASYIINKGIAPERVTAKGYGFTAPLPDCDNDNMRLNKERCNKNSRTEFVVTSDLIE